MKIVIELDDSTDEYEAQQMVEYFESEPWCYKAYIEKDCSKCTKLCLND